MLCRLLSTGLNIETLGTCLIDTHQRHRTESAAFRGSVTTVEKDKRPVPGRPDPHAETRDPRVSDRVFGFLRAQPRNAAGAEAHPSGHGSVLPAKNWNERFGRLVDSRIGKMRVFQRGCRIVMAQQLADREDRLAMGKSHGCECMAVIPDSE